MIRVSPRLTVAHVVCLVTAVLACGTDTTADMVFRGGFIYTADSTNPTADAVAVRDGRIVFVGDSVDVHEWIGPRTVVIDIGNGMLLPGFHDTHVHPVSGGIELEDCDLNAAGSRNDVVAMVAACVERTTGPWLRGGGFQLPLFPNGAPPKELLDSLSPDRPAYLSSADGHSAWVNSRALALAGIDGSTPDPPPDGVIVRTETGDPQGTLRESAMGLVGRHVPEHTDAELLAGLVRALRMAAEFGITTFHEASAREAYLRAYRAAEEQGVLTARAIVALWVDPDVGIGEVERLRNLRDTYTSRLVQPRAAKIFVDGVIEGQTAALLAPYTDRPDFSGELNLDPDSLAALVGALDDAGFKVHVHAIGDRAIRVTFDAFEAQRARDNGAGPRHLMAHIQLFDPVDIPRFAELGVVASFQPLWFYADEYITDLTEPRLGPGRSRWLYPIKSVVATGAPLAAGSDWSVSSMNPLRAIEVALTRRNPSIDEGPSWIPEEVVDLETMLRAYTVGGAFAGDLEAETGSLTVGKAADLTMLERNLFAIPPHEVAEVAVAMTVFEGRVVFERRSP